MKKLWQGLLVFCALIGGYLGTTMVAHAQAVGYTVQVVKSKQQDDPTVSYFALRAQPGARHTIQIIIRNQTNRAQAFNVHVTQAITNSNGIIDYSQYHPQLDPSLTVKMQALFTRPKQTVTVPASGKRTVSLTYQMPARRFRGCVLGGIYVIQAHAPAAKKTRSKIQLRDIFAYAISVRLRESAQNVAPALKLRQVTVGQIDRQNLVTANLQNFEPGIMPTLAITATVKTQHGLTPLLQQHQTNLGMAPNSNFNFALPWGNHQLRAGRYVLNLTARAGGKEWHFVRQFQITPQALRKLGPTVPTAHKPAYWLYLVLALIIALLLAIIGYLIYRNRRLGVKK